MELSIFLLFAATTFVVVLTPGPAAIAVASQASSNGIARSQAVVGGVAVLPGFMMTPWILEPAFVTVALLNATAVSENLLLLAAVYRRP